MIEAEIIPPSQTTEAPASDQSAQSPMTKSLATSEKVHHEIWIRNRSGWIPIDWWEMVSHHELLVFLMWRDLSARYKQTVLGSLWAVVQPLIMMTVFTLIFGKAGGNTYGYPYPVFVFAGLIPWSMFSQGFNASALSLVNQQHLLTKVYLPRLFVPIAAASIFIIDLVIALVIYVIFILFYGYTLGWTAIFIPPLIALTLISTLSMGLIISALTVFYRDFRHLVPFITQMLLFMSCVIISPEGYSQRYRWVLSLNPMFGTIVGFRAALLKTPCDLTSVAISTASAIILLIFGVFYFTRTERKFADFA